MTEIVLRSENVTRQFHDGTRELRVLNDVSISLEAGTVSALVGRSGSGKSTLLHILGLLDQPTSGEVFVDDHPVGQLAERHRSKVRNTRIGFVFQHFFLLPDFNVLDNVLMPARIRCSLTEWAGAKGAHEQRAFELLKLVGLENQLGQSTRTLSGGERQRVAFARAMLLNPRILLCDEPTGNLDPESGERIMNLIFEACSGSKAAALIVTHDMAIAARAGRVLRLESGSLKM